jgi:hypothetical protein
MGKKHIENLLSIVRESCLEDNEEQRTKLLFLLSCVGLFMVNQLFINSKKTCIE